METPKLNTIIAANDGVLCVATLSHEPDAVIDVVGLDHGPVVAGTIGLLRLSGEDQIRVKLGTTTITAIKSRGGFACMVLVTGHEVVKSAKRMMRRLARNLEITQASPDLAIAPATQAQPPG